MSSKKYEENAYGRSLDSAIISLMAYITTYEKWVQSLKWSSNTRIPYPMFRELTQWQWHSWWSHHLHPNNNMMHDGVRHVLNLATHRTSSTHLISLDWRAQWQTDNVELWCREEKMKGGDKTYGALSEPPWRNVVHQRHAQMGCGSGNVPTLTLFLWIATCFVLREDLPARGIHIDKFDNWSPKFESIQQSLTLFIYEYIC